MKSLKLLLLSLILCSITACYDDKIDEYTQNNDAVSSSWRTVDNTTVPSGPGVTVLGTELQNPYDLVNVNAAYQLLTGYSGNLSATHYYVKLLPTNGQHILDIAGLEEDFDYEFELQPLHFYEVYLGDDGYIDPTIPETGGFAPEYGAISAAHYEEGIFNDIPHEVLNIMHIPVYETRLTFTAFVISGNEQFYEAIDGFCHPDCPSWPACLENENLTCQVDNLQDDLESINPNYVGERTNFPDYIVDNAMGIDGRFPDPTGCHFVRNTRESVERNCDLTSCSVILVPLEHEPDICEWKCDCDEEVDPGNGNQPPFGQTEKCNCFVYQYKKKPGGRVTVEDSQLGNEGVRRIKVKATKRYWGFIWSNTNTDDNGCWKLNKKYNVRRAKVKAVFKDRVSDRAVIRSVRGIRVWNAFLKPVKHKWRIKRTNKNWHSLCLNIGYSEDNNSREEQSHVAATLNNALHEYYDDHLDLPTEDGKLSILMNNWRGDASAPMFKQMGVLGFSLFDFQSWLVSFGAVLLPSSNIVWEFIKPDIIYGFEDNRRSDDIKRTMYHELAHSSQFQRMGADWWEDYVQYILSVSGTGQRQPYGNGTLVGAGRAEITEAMAESIAFFMADLQYGLNHSVVVGGGQRFRYINRAEELNFWNGNTNFIPEGLFFDLFDENGVTPNLSVTEVGGVLDLVDGIGFDDQINALNPNIQTIEQFRNELWLQFAQPNGITANDFNNLFQSYGF